jgi:hypothetical protein
MSYLMMESYCRRAAIAGILTLTVLSIGATSARAQETPPTTQPAPAAASDATAPVPTAPPAAATPEGAPTAAPTTESAAPQPAPVSATAAPVSPAPYYFTPPPPQKPHRSKALLIAGIATFGGAYLFSAAVGLLWWTANDNGSLKGGEVCGNCDAGPKLFLPIAGPFWAIPDADGADGKAVAILMGSAQIVGLGLLIAGIIYVSSGDDDEKAEEKRFGVALSPSGSGLSLRF